MKQLLERNIQCQTLGEREILYHEGRIKMKKKENNMVAAFKHTILITHAKLYYGNITVQEIKDTLTAIFVSKCGIRNQSSQQCREQFPEVLKNPSVQSTILILLITSLFYMYQISLEIFCILQILVIIFSIFIHILCNYYFTHFSLSH